MLIDESFLDLFNAGGLYREPTLKDLVRWADAKGLVLSFDMMVPPNRPQDAPGMPSDESEAPEEGPGTQNDSEASESDSEGSEVGPSKHDPKGFDYDSEPGGL